MIDYHEYMSIFEDEDDAGRRTGGAGGIEAGDDEGEAGGAAAAAGKEPLAKVAAGRHMFELVINPCNASKLQAFVQLPGFDIIRSAGGRQGAAGQSAGSIPFSPTSYNALQYYNKLYCNIF